MANLLSISNIYSFILGCAKKGGERIKGGFRQAYQGNTFIERVFYAGICQRSRYGVLTTGKN